MRTTVTKEMLREADREIRKLGVHRANVKLSKVEPELVDHVDRGITRTCRKLKNSGVIDHEPAGADHASPYPDILQIVLCAVEAQRKAQYALITQLRERRGSSAAPTIDDGALVSAEMLDEVEAALWPIGRDRAMRELHPVEPELQRFIVRVHGSIQEQIAGYEIPEPVREMLAEQVMLMGVICVCATRERYVARRAGEAS